VGQAELARVGERVKFQGWEVTLIDFGPYERFSSGQPPAALPQGVLVVADLRITNIQNRLSEFTPNDFALRSSDGREFKAAAQTASIERGLAPRQTVQPRATTENRVAFDVPPDATHLVLEALEIEFSVPTSTGQ
jgi:hypothetical protein